VLNGTNQQFYDGLDSIVISELKVPIAVLREGKKQDAEMLPRSVGAHARLFDQVNAISVYDLFLGGRGNSVTGEAGDDNERQWIRDELLEGLARPVVGAERPRSDIAVSATTGGRVLGRLLTLYSRLTDAPDACGVGTCRLAAVVAVFRDDAGDLSMGRPMAFVVPESRQSYRAMFHTIIPDLLADVLAELREARE
jgi:hypothetical protein